jgi:hypothetical protein
MDIKHSKKIRKVFRIFVYIFATVGFTFAVVFFLMQCGFLNVRGSISQRNAYFNFVKKKNTTTISSDTDLVVICKINTLTRYAPLTSINIYKTLIHGGNDLLINQMISTASKRFETDPTFGKNMSSCTNAEAQNLNVPLSAYTWADTDQWSLMKEVFTRDQDIIKKAAVDADVNPRLILAGVVGEQFRFFNSRREVFKSYFEPMKILASLSNTSYGIAGLKPKTIAQIEEHLADRKSPFYLGPSMEHIADHEAGVSIDDDRMNRITDVKNPYYTYLYVGLYMKQIETQWKNAGYDISNRPDILATLYNLGFYYSVPKLNPQPGGTVINIANVDYTFGDLGYEFYYSGELSETFPLAIQ